MTKEETFSSKIKYVIMRCAANFYNWQLMESIGYFPNPEDAEEEIKELKRLDEDEKVQGLPAFKDPEYLYRIAMLAPAIHKDDPPIKALTDKDRAKIRREILKRIPKTRKTR